MKLPPRPELAPKPRQRLRGPVPTAAEPQRVRRRSRRSASTGELLQADLCGRGLRLGIVAVLLIGMAAVGRSLWQQDAARQADRTQVSTPRVAVRQGQPRGKSLFDAAPRHTAPVLASAPSSWDQRSAAGALVPVMHPTETNAPVAAVLRMRQDESVVPARVAAVTLRWPDASAFHFAEPAPAPPVALSRQVPVRATGSGSVPAGGTPINRRPAVVGAQPAATTSTNLFFVDQTDGNSPYTLNAGNTLTVGDLSEIGTTSTGIFIQNGGTFNAGSTLELGAQANSNGTLTLSAGLLSTGVAEVGSEGQGTFNQQGGTVTVSNGLEVGTFYSGGGTYTLSAGTLSSTGGTDVGDAAAGTFTQSGGHFTNSGGLTLGYFGGGGGTYKLNGGTLTTDSVAGGEGASTFNFSGGTLQASASDAPNDPNHPTTFFSGVGTTTVQQGGAIIDSNGFSVTVAQNLVTDPALNGAADGGLAVLSTLSGGTLTLTGANTYTGATTVNGGTLAVVSGGSVTGGNVNVNAGATLAISGTGSVAPGSSAPLTVDGTSASPAAVTLADTGSLSTGPAIIGNNGPGTFTQSGGSFTTNGQALDLGYNSGSSGTYTLSGSGSSLSTGPAFIGFSGTGTLTQNGGSFTTNGSAVDLADQSGSVGTYNLNGGTLNTGQVDSGSSGNGSTSTFNFNGGTLQAGAGSSMFLQGLTTATVQAGGAIIDSNGFSVTVAQNLVTDPALKGAADGGLTVLDSVGGGTLTLTGANTYTGATTVNGGTLQASVASAANGSSGAFGSNSAVVMANTAGATLDLNGFNTQIGSLTGGGTTGGNVTLGSATLTTGGDNTSPAAYAGVISGTGALTKIGTGTQTLGGTNTYTGGTNVTAGTLLELNNGNALSTGTVAISSGATVALESDSGNNISQAGASTFTGAGTLAKTGAGNLAFGGNGGTVTIALSQGGVIDVQGGTLNGSSSYQADYTNNQGSLHIAAGATFNGAEGTVVFDALTGAGTLEGGYQGNGSTTIGVANGSGTFSGVIQDNTGIGTLSLTKVGSGTETLTGTNTYTGSTTVSGGTLAVAAGGSITGGGLLTVDGTGASAAAVTLVSGGSLSTSYAEIGVSGTGSFTQSGGSFTTNGNTLYLGDSRGTRGTYTLSDSGSGSSLSTGEAVIGLEGMGTFTQNGGTFAAGSDVDLAAAPDSSGTYNLNAGTLNTGQVDSGADGRAAGTSTFNFNGGTLQANAGSTTFLQGLTTANVQANGAFIDSNGFSVTVAQNLTTDPALKGAADGGLTVLSTLSGGTLTLTGANTYTGPTTLASGVLNVGSTGALGSTSQINFNGGTLQYSSANQTDYSPRFSTANNQSYNIDTNGQSVTYATGLTSQGGSLTVLDSMGGGTLTLTGANTYTGNTNVYGGTLAVAAGGSITGGGVLTVDATSDSPAAVTLVSGGSLSTIAAVIGNYGTGSFTQSGGSFTTNSYALVLGESPGSSGTYTLSDSGSGSSLSAGYALIGSSGTGSFTQNGGTFAGGSIVVLADGPGSSGTYSLNGGVLTTDSVTGGAGTSTFNFNGGTLRAAASDAPNDPNNPTTFFGGLSTASVQAGGAIIDTQAFNVTVAQNLVSGVNSSKPTVIINAVAPTTDGGLTKLGTGTLTLTGTSSYTGPTSVNAGTLAVNGSLTGTGMLTVSSGATLAGTGSAAGNVSVLAGGTLAPGQAGAGTLTLGGNLTLTGTATAAFALSGVAGNTRADVAGQVNLGSQATLSLRLATGTLPTVNQKFYLLDTTGTSLVLGGFVNAPLTGSIFVEDGVTYQINYLDTDPSDPGKTALNDVSVTILAIPEPGTWALLLVGGAGMLGLPLRRQRRRAQRLRSPDWRF